jgi:hypothetical protein
MADAHALLYVAEVDYRVLTPQLLEVCENKVAEFLQ